MRFGLVHRVMTNALAALGVMALVASGELGRWVNVAIVVGLIAALSVPEAWNTKPWLNRLAAFGPVVLLGVQVTRWFLNRPMLELAVEFAAALQIVRLATRRGAAHDQQVIVLALLHLIAGTVLGGGLGYGVCFLGFLVVAPGALVLSHLRREVEGNYRQGARDRTGLPVDVPRILRSRRVVGRTFLIVTCCLSVPILIFTSALFLVFPRVGLSLLLLNRPSAGRMIGFSDHVDLGGVGTLRDDPTVALHVDIPDIGPTPPDRVTFYLRGTAFDAYDGRAWSRTSIDRRPAMRDRNMIYIERAPDKTRDRLVKIELEYFEPPVLFIPPNATAMEVRSRTDNTFIGNSPTRVERGPEGEFRYRSSDDRGVHYDVWISRTALQPSPPLGRDDRGRYLTLPPLDRRVATLAGEWIKNAQTPLEKARAIEEHLRTEYRYDLASPSGGNANPLEHFLFESKRGHCEFYSTAMAVMLRQAGIPSRNVTGYIGGTYNRFARNYTVRQGDAHSWVEAYIDGLGWQTFDPTPPTDAAPRSEIRGMFALLRDLIEASSQRWDRHIVAFDLQQQLSLLERVRFGLRDTRLPSSMARWGVLASLALVVLAGLAWRYFHRTRTTSRAPRSATEESRTRAATAAAAVYELLDTAMVVQGLSRPQGMPPLRHAESQAVRAHPLGAEILALTEQYLEVRFGGGLLDEQQRREFERRVKLVRGYRAKAASAGGTGGATGAAAG
jgi:protein-glutamine gamma-glutamyltransferase